MKPRRLFLVGPPGAGKSTLARRWAHSLGVPHIDTDAEIERRSGSSIAALFAAGEKPFRQWEREVIQALLREGFMGIWALGGYAYPSGAERTSAPRRLPFMDRPAAKLDFASAPARKLRPAIAPSPVPSRVEAFLEKRRQFYRIADLHWDPTRVPASLVRAWVARQLSRSADIPFASTECPGGGADTAAAPNTALPPETKSHSAAPPLLPSQE